MKGLSMKVLVRSAAIAAALLSAAGCLDTEIKSDAALLDAKSGAARPVAPGDYEFCKGEEGADGDCQRMSVAPGADGAHLATRGDGEAVYETRFAPLGDNAWIMQALVSGEDGAAYLYFLLRAENTGFSILGAECDALSEDVRRGLICQKGMKPSGCFVTSPAALKKLMTEFRDHGAATTKFRATLTAAAQSAE
jgi:hypothetical protein